MKKIEKQFIDKATALKHTLNEEINMLGYKLFHSFMNSPNFGENYLLIICWVKPEKSG